MSASLFLVNTTWQSRLVTIVKILVVSVIVTVCQELTENDLSQGNMKGLIFSKVQNLVECESFKV